MSVTGKQNPNPQTEFRLGWGWRDGGMLGMLLLATLWAVRPLWQPGLSNSTDLLLSIYRVFELKNAWDAGIFFPRLGPNLNFGYGAPLFQFYPPLVSYGILGFHSLGFGYIEATKLMLAGNLLLCGVGAYCYSRWLTQQCFPALLAGIGYLYAPYTLLVTYERGAAAEALALALLPWLLWSVHRLLSDSSFHSVVFAALMVAAIMLAHNITALFAIPLVCLLCSFLIGWEQKWRDAGRVGAAVALGLALSLFYWLPAIVELRFTQTESMMLSGWTQIDNWLSSDWRSMLHSSLFVPYMGDELFRFSLWLSLLAVTWIVCGMVVQRTFRLYLFLFLSVWLVVLFVQTKYAYAIWHYVPLIQFIQFPWRLYGIASLSVAMATALVFADLQRFRSARYLIGAFGLGLIFISIATSMRHLIITDFPYYRPITSEQITLPDLFERGRIGYALFSDYSPVDMKVIGGAISLPRSSEEEVETERTTAEVNVLQTSANRLELVVDSAAPFSLRYHRIFFPGWQIYVDGEAIPTGASGILGLVTASIPAGAHQVRIVFQSTTVRWICNLVSLCALVLLVAIFVLGFSARLRLLVLLLVGMSTLGVGLYFWQATSRSTHQPTAYRAKLGDTADLVGFQIAEPVVRAGSSLHLQIFWFARQAPPINYKVFIHLLLPDDSGRVAQLDHEPFIGYNPTTRWMPGELIPDRYELPLDATIKPGTYLVAVGIYDPATGQNLPVMEGNNTLPGDRIGLTSIEVR